MSTGEFSQIDLALSKSTTSQDVDLVLSTFEKSLANKSLPEAKKQWGELAYYLRKSQSGQALGELYAHAIQQAQAHAQASGQGK